MKLDRLIELLFQEDVDRVVLESGKRALLCSGEESRPLTNAPIAAKVLTECIREIAPEPLLSELNQNGESRFLYDSPHGRVVALVNRDGDRVTVAFGRDETESTTAHAVTMNQLFLKMVESGCSDLHLSSGNPPLYRKDGAIVELEESDPLDPDRVRDLLYSITPPTRLAEFEERNDTDFGYEIAGVARFRCNLFRDRKGIGGVFRVIPAEILTAEDLELSEHILQLCHLNKGLVVVTGPTGSGKSTTLAAMIDYINRNRSDHVITIEDPIEFVHANRECLINQREVGDHTRGFKAALRAALREDPDVVLVGEMRDLETVAIAIETAETGHLVFGTLHTNTAPSTVDRMIDQFPVEQQNQVRTMLSESLKGVIAQTLCKKVDGGRVAALEVLIVNRAVSNLIREAKTFQIPSIMQAGGKLGMVTLNDSLVDLVVRGIVDPHEACRRALDPIEFMEILKRKGLIEEEVDPNSGIMVLKHLN